MNQTSKAIVVKTLMTTQIFVGEGQIQSMVEPIVEEAFKNLKEAIAEQVESDDLLLAKKGCTRKVEALLIDRDNTVGCACLAFEQDVPHEQITRQLQEQEADSQIMGWKLYDLSLETLD